ncbi:Cohesin subunit SA-1 [Hordeum vulgare]|nr:Cohesin subunit SA-1 [Hordeum vulgare]
MMSTAIAPFSGLGISVFNSCVVALMSTASDSFCMSVMEPKFEHTSMAFSNLVRSPFNHPRKKALQPIPQGKGLALELEMELMAMERRKVDSERREGIEESNEMGTEVLPAVDKKGKATVHSMPEVVLPPTTEEEPKTPTVGDDERMEDPPNNKRRNYDHYHEEGGPTHFCKVILAPKLECMPMPLDFTKHFAAVPAEFKLMNNTSCS